MMMFYSKTPTKPQMKEEQIRPWNADETSIMNIIIQSEKHTPKPKKIMFNNTEQRQKQRLLEQGNSYNFYTNLRKYEKKKAEDFLSKKEVNFIQRNIKGVSQEFPPYQVHTSQYLVDKMIQDRQQKTKMMHSQFSCTIEPIDWNLITQYEEKKAENRHRQRIFQNFIRFQSQNNRKPTFKQINNQETMEDDESAKLDSEKYRKILKMRQGLRKRNLKSCDDSLKMENTLSIQQNWKSSKLTSVQKVTLASAKKSHAVRRKNTLSKVESQQESQLLGMRSKIYSSQQNRIKVSLRAIN